MNANEWKGVGERRRREIQWAERGDEKEERRRREVFHATYANARMRARTAQLNNVDGHVGILILVVASTLHMTAFSDRRR